MLLLLLTRGATEPSSLDTVKTRKTRHEKHTVWGTEKADEMTKEGRDVDHAVMAEIISQDAAEVRKRFCAVLSYAANSREKVDKLIEIQEIIEELEVKYSEGREHSMMKAVNGREQYQC